MRKNKIGTIFIVLIFALTGIGITYSGFTDNIQIHGIVDTATVELEIVDYSGTDVWKVWGENCPEDEIFVWHGFRNANGILKTIAEILNE